MIQEYRVSGYIKAGGVVLPVLDIPQMSDNEWNQRAGSRPPDSTGRKPGRSRKA